MSGHAGPEELRGTHAVVLGAAGFLGSHLCDRLVNVGARVTAIDNLITGDAENVAHLVGRPGFRLISYDVTDYLHVPGNVDFVLHFASPASPVDYLRWPIQTLKVGSLGTHKALGLARAKDARFLLASTSEVYGDPLVNPQPETYWGNVNPVGPRGVYDEAKRFAEALTLAYHRQHTLDVRIGRIFNSILADEQVLYDDGTVLRRESAETLARRLGGQVDLWGYRVPAFDGAACMQSAEATGFVGHRTTSRCFEVRTRYGRSIRVTGDHSLFVEDTHGGPVAKPVSQLAVGDRVAIAGRVAVPERDRTEVDVAEVWDRLSIDPWALSVTAPGLGETVWRHRQELLGAVMAHRGVRGEAGRRSSWDTVIRWRDTDSLPLAAFRRIGLSLPPEARVRKARSRFSLPSKIAISDELLWLLGLFLADGCRFDEGVERASITISCDETLLRRAAKVVERDLGLHVVWSPGTPGIRASAISVHSQPLLVVLDHLSFDVHGKRIPGWVLGLPLTRLKWFIEGYREGDGVHSDVKRPAERMHEFSTVSEELTDDLVVALGRFGIVPSVGRHEATVRARTGDRRYPVWRVTVPHVSPWSPLAWDRGVHQRLQARRTGDLVWASVTSIEEVEPTDLVYDFCVPGFENFWAGTGLLAKNTYGPRMRVNDGRAVPAFFGAALRNEPLPVHGDGLQTRSLCYVDDQIDGQLRLLVSDVTGPVNLGNPHEVTMLELAEAVQEAVGNRPGVTFLPRPTDDPTVRRPDTTLAEQALGWKAEVSLRDGLARTVDWFRQQLGVE